MFIKQITHPVAHHLRLLTTKVPQTKAPQTNKISTVAMWVLNYFNARIFKKLF